MALKKNSNMVGFFQVSFHIAVPGRIDPHMGLRSRLFDMQPTRASFAVRRHLILLSLLPDNKLILGELNYGLSRHSRD